MMIVKAAVKLVVVMQKILRTRPGKIQPDTITPCWVRAYRVVPARPGNFIRHVGPDDSCAEPT